MIYSRPTVYKMQLLEYILQENTILVCVFQNFMFN